MRRKNQRGVTLMIGTMAMVFLVPLIGLGVDVGFVFAVHSKLQTAIDGSVLAAARALSLGETTSAQVTSAQNHAQNWFNANFPSGYFGTHNTSQGIVDSTNGCATSVVACVYNDPNNPNLVHVESTVTTEVDTFFMKWFGLAYTTVAATSDATRRNVVAMMVLDRSGSMNLSGSCPNLISAAQLFTGQFAAGRDYIGAVSFSDGPYLHSTPTTSFQTVLGYANDYGSASGQLTNIQCNGGTGTPAAMAWAYDQLYKTNLPGALNLIVLETDGLPNTMELNFYDSANKITALVKNSGCKDTSSTTVKNGGFGTSSVIPTWTSSHAMASTFYGTIPGGMIGSIYSGDPWQEAQGEYFLDMFDPYQSSYSTGNNSNWLSSTASGCAFSSGGGGNENVVTNDFAWTPMTDVYGNQLNPATNPYQSGIVTCGPTTCGGYQTAGSGTYLNMYPSSGDGSTNWTNYHKGALNATDNAAYQARTNSTLPVYVFVIGLGGNCTPSCTASESSRTGDPPDFVLLQRMANDPNGDMYNDPPNYSSCASETSSSAPCVNYPSQPQGTFIFSTNKTQLTQAFLQISSQVLRLSH